MDSWSAISCCTTNFVSWSTKATAKAMPNTYKVNSSYYVTYSHFILAYDKDTIQ